MQSEYSPWPIKKWWIIRTKVIQLTAACCVSVRVRVCACICACRKENVAREGDQERPWHCIPEPYPLYHTPKYSSIWALITSRDHQNPRPPLKPFILQYAQNTVAIPNGAAEHTAPKPSLELRGKFYCALRPEHGRYILDLSWGTLERELPPPVGLLVILSSVI